MQTFFSSLLILFVISCNNLDRKVILKDRMASLAPKENGAKYFSVDTNTGQRNILESWADRVLFDLKEPVLVDYKANSEFIRFVWLRSFENPVVVRVNKFGDTVYATIKELKLKAADTASAVILKDTLISLDVTLWQELMKPLEKSNFWNFQYADSSLNEDGAIWFLEYKDSKRYKVIRRWDTGRLLSEPFKSYLEPLVNLVTPYVSLESLR